MNQYPIRAISELTGVPATTLRAWERRYGLLKPARTRKGHRLYSPEDIDLVKQVVVLLKSNHTISQAIDTIRNCQLHADTSPNTADHWASYQRRALKAVERFSTQNLDTIYNEALSVYPVDMVTQHLIIPVLDTLGERWQNRDAGIAEEHFFSAYLRNKLGARLHHESGRSKGSKILVSCLPGEYHELGVLLFCIAAIAHGYQILYLGSNMPPAQLQLVIQQTDIAGILLSGTNAERWDSQLELEVTKLIDSTHIPVMLGGNISDVLHTQLEYLGAHVLGSAHETALQRMESIIPAFIKK